MISYICKEPYFSRMIVEYSVEGKKITEVGEESGSTVKIPKNGRKIKVRFQNQRFIGTWCDVKKYDLEKKCWEQPTIPHVFTFPEPVTRTFTLEGSLHYVAVMEVRNWNVELNVIKYVCSESYFSRMIVEYLDVGSKKIKKSVEGSGSIVGIPAHARNIKVRFQNQRFIGTWCDVKKYDRNKKCWCEPIEPHVFTFPEPVTRTFSLEGSLCYVAVMKVTNEFYDEIDIMQ